MGFLLDFQFLTILSLFVLLLWFVLSPYTASSTASSAPSPAGSRWGNMSIPYVIMVVVTIIVFIADVVFMAGGHAH